ncbi:MAG: primosomal protein N' [Parcubacteria group bacterium CG08_land_8_20_14_0_20_43_9]|nr:MAG: primosomal protein N' [Parcubacteria group bacterium CG08_land_8_20_14_0_20_43_9]
MYIIEIIPLIKIASCGSQTLTYFSSQKPGIGSLVLAPLGRTEIKAIVKSVEPLENIKMEVKKKYFKLKPISKIISEEPIVTEAQMGLCQWLSDYYLSPIGIVLKLFLPKSVLRRKKLSALKKSFPSPAPENQNQPLRPVLLNSPERSQEYVSAVKGALQDKKSVLFLVPEINKISQYLPRLEKISKNIRVFHSELKTSEEMKCWQEVRDNEIDIIIGTRNSLFLPFPNLGLIVVDEEENESYKSWDQHPKYHTRTVALKLAKIFKAKIILGSQLPSPESFYRAKIGEYQLLQPKIKSQSGLDISLVDMREEARKTNYSIFSEELREQLANVIPKNKKVIIFVSRKGLAAAVLCRDCGHIIKCRECETPMVYHKTNGPEKGLLICHYCGKTMAPPSLCPKCKSWRIKYLGAGTQKIMEELGKIEGVKISAAIMDSDITPDRKKQEQISQDFQAGKYNVLVGTHLLFSSGLQQKADLVVVILADPLFNIPEFRSPERLMKILFKISALAKGTIIQTYNPDFYLFDFLKRNDFEGFLEQELKHRKALSYPPFSEVIKLTFSHKNNERARKEALEMKRKIQKSAPALNMLGPAPALVPKIRNKYFWHIIAKIKSDGLKEKKIIREIMGPDWSADVEPQTLL